MKSDTGPNVAVIDLVRPGTFVRLFLSDWHSFNAAVLPLARALFVSNFVLYVILRLYIVLGVGSNRIVSRFHPALAEQIHQLGETGVIQMYVAETNTFFAVDISSS